METAPQAVDTLREEEICPVCGSDFEQGHQCEVCGYVAPPDGLDNPDLQKSQEENPLEQPDPQMPADPQVPPTSTNVGNPGMPTNPGVSANVKIDMSNSWKLFHPRIAGRINPVEKPIVAGNPPASNEPSETIVQDQTQPVTSRTAASMIAAVNNKENMMSRTSADAPTADTRADKRTDVEGVGGVYDGSNEEASKADAQVDVEGVGGTGVEGVAADRTDSIEETSENAGFDKKKNIEGTPTQTWPNKNQHTPVTREPFPASEDGVKKSHDDSPFPPDNENIGGGSANQGTQPVDPVGKAQDRVDVLEHVTSPANNSGPTKTWSGTDGNGVTKQRDPVTNETLVGDDNINLFKDSHIFQAFKLADLEIELGLLNSEYKYARVAELGNETPETIKAQITTLAKVRSAGLRKSTATKRNGIGRVPSFRPTASTKPASESDESLFL